jgi:hypothetical protein
VKGINRGEAEGIRKVKRPRTSRDKRINQTDNFCIERDESFELNLNGDII